jgi:peptidase M20/M25/M40-like protein/peptidase-like protein
VTANDLTVLDLLHALVRIDSVNPGLDPGGAGEAQIAAFVVEWGRATGLRTQVLERTPGRPSVILRGGQNTGGRRLLLSGHLDTVGLAGTRDALTPRVDGDRLYARGAYDMKAGLAAALIACRDAALTGIPGEVIVATVADEELASLGIQEVLAYLDLAGIDAAVVTEPTERQAGTAHRGFVWTEVTVTGTAAHGSRPHLGADAILAAGHHLVAFDHLDQQLRGRPHPSLGTGNLHASLITGGTEESTIPAAAYSRSNATPSPERPSNASRPTSPTCSNGADPPTRVSTSPRAPSCTARQWRHQPAPPSCKRCSPQQGPARPWPPCRTGPTPPSCPPPVSQPCSTDPKGRSPRRHRMGQPHRHQNHHHRPHPARPGLLLLSRPHPAPPRVGAPADYPDLRTLPTAPSRTARVRAERRIFARTVTVERLRCAIT